jgi:hypothetical protein
MLEKSDVIPAKAGIRSTGEARIHKCRAAAGQTPAFAGVTTMG